MAGGLKHLKQVLTVALSAAMILTSVPQGIMAAELDKEAVADREIAAALDQVPEVVADETDPVPTLEDGGLQDTLISDEGSDFSVDGEADTVSEDVVIKFDISPEVTEIRYMEFDRYGSKAVGSEVVLSGESLTGECKIKRGDRIDIIGITCGDPEADLTYFKTVTLPNGEHFWVNSVSPFNAIETKAIDEDATIEIRVARLPISDIEFVCDSVDGVTAQMEIYPAYITEDGGVRYVDASTVEMVSNIAMTIGVNDEDKANIFRVKGVLQYEIAGKSKGELSVLSDARRQFFNIPATVLIDAAEAGAKIIVRAEIEKLGYRREAVRVFRGSDTDKKPEGVVVKAGSDILTWHNNNYETDYGYWSAYGEDVSVVVNSRDGYTLRKVCYLTEAAYKAMSGTDDEKYAAITAAESLAGVTVVTPENGLARFTINGIDDSYRVFVVEDGDYIVKVNENELAFGETVNVAYNIDEAIRPVVSVLKDGKPQDLSLAKLSANVVSEGGTAVDVTADVFGTVSEGDQSVTFDPSSDKVRGKSVNVSITKGASGTDDGYALAFVFAVGGPISPETVSFESDVENILGTETTVTLKAGSDYVPGTLGVEVTGADDLPVAAWMTADGTGVTVKSRVTGEDTTAVKSLLSSNSLGLKLYDLNDPSKAAINECSLNVTAAQVTDTALSGNIIITTDNDTVNFDFAGVQMDCKEADGLYYEISLVRKGESDSLVEEATRIEPATVKGCGIILAKTDDSYEPESIAYDVKVRLIQSTNPDIYFFDTVVEEDIVACSNKYLNEEAKTVPGGTFPIGISFVQTKDKAVLGRLYDTLDEEVKIGTVVFDKIGKEYPTVQRINYIYIDGIINMEAAYFQKGPEIYVNPAKAGAGKHTVYIYAVEPAGCSVYTSFEFTVNKGIQSIYIDAPYDVYKPAGKKVTVNVKANCYDKKSYYIPAADVKLSWSLASDKKGTPLEYPGVSIKDGVITFEKDFVIPEDGFKMFVFAKAADYVGNETTGYFPFYDEYPDMTVHATADPIEHITLGNRELIDGASYTTAQFLGNFAAYDSSMRSISNVRFTVKGLKSKKNSSGTYYLVDKPNIKKVTVTAERTDGSGLKKSVTVNIKGNANIQGIIYDDSHLYIAAGSNNTSVKAENRLSAGRTMYLYVTSIGNGIFDHSVKVTGAKKKLSPEESGTGTVRLQVPVYAITPTAPVTTIKLTEKATGEYAEFTINNTMINGAKASTSVKGSNKVDFSYGSGKIKSKDNKGNIYNALYFANAAAYESMGSCNRVTYTVKCGKGADAKKVRLRVDDWRLTDVFSKNAGLTRVSDGEYEVPLTNGQFVIDYAFKLQGNGNPEGATFYVPAGKYSFDVTPLDENGVVVGKRTTVKFKAAPAPAFNVVINGKPLKNFVSQCDIQLEKAANVAIKNGEPCVEFTRVYGINQKGKISSFKSTFAVSGNKLTCIKPVRADEEKSITGCIMGKVTGIDGKETPSQVVVTIKPPKGGKITPTETP
ncbi:MAG: hypothetical protein K6E63_05065 [Lachnospiraceae bacterium]|nr:hypothetical protein [Lachnospiraceae bacterium]